jgi:class 3 adenylate cyclase
LFWQAHFRETSDPRRGATPLFTIQSPRQEGILESHRHEIVVLFSDLPAFSAFAEMAAPEEVVSFLGVYYRRLAALTHEFGGALERVAGAGLMVWFNDPLPCPDPCAQAVRLAIEMRACVQELAAEWDIPLGFAAGIASGHATLGRIDFEGRSEYAAIGAAVNVAAALCREADEGQILVDANVRAAIDAIATLAPAGEIALKGLDRPMGVFHIRDLAAQVTPGDTPPTN